MKRILVISYSQTGQLHNITQSITVPLENDEDIELTHLILEPEKSFSFPWPFWTFFDTFPETVALQPAPLKPFTLESMKFDLVILAYQVWFLSPAMPMTAFLQSTQGRLVLKDTPVITVIACRNMWLMAQERVKEMLANAQAKLIDNVVFTDKGSALATFITTPRWMLTGKRDAFLGFPRAGIDDETIAHASRFGRAISQGFKFHANEIDQPLLSGLQAVEVDTRLIASEKVGLRSFRVWSKLLRLAGRPGDFPRRCLLFIYILFLVALILTVVPLSMLLRKLLHPLQKNSLLRQKSYYEAPSGSGKERMKDFMDA